MEIQTTQSPFAYPNWLFKPIFIEMFLKGLKYKHMNLDMKKI